MQKTPGFCSLFGHSLSFADALSFTWSLKFVSTQGSFLCHFLFSLQQSLLCHVFSYSSCTSVQFSSVTQSCPTLCDPMNRSTPGLPVHHKLPEFTQIHVHRVSDAIQSSHPRSSPSPPAPNSSQHQSLLQWVNSSQKVARVLEFQLQHHSLQRNLRADLLQKGLPLDISFGRSFINA